MTSVMKINLMKGLGQCKQWPEKAGGKYRFTEVIACLVLFSFTFESHPYGQTAQKNLLLHSLVSYAVSIFWGIILICSQLTWSNTLSEFPPWMCHIWDSSHRLLVLPNSWLVLKLLHFLFDSLKMCPIQEVFMPSAFKCLTLQGIFVQEAKLCTVSIYLMTVLQFIIQNSKV